MSQNNEKDNAQNQENITEFLELLTQTYSDDGAAPTEPASTDSDDSSNLSAEELQERLRMQFMVDENGEETESEDSYAIDESFLEEVVLDSEPEETVAIEEIEEIEKTEEVEEIEEVEESNETDETDKDLDDDITFDEIVEEIDENDPEYVSIALDDDTETYDDEITFDELDEKEDENDPEYISIALDDDTEDNTHIELADTEESFDDLESFLNQDEKPILTELKEEQEAPSIVTIIETATPEYFKAEMPELKDLTLVNEDEAVAETNEESTNIDDDFLSEFFTQDIENAEKKEEVPQNNKVLDSIANNSQQPLKDEAELSLLMQFGCEEDVLSAYSNNGSEEKDELDREILTNAEKNFASNVRKIHGEYSKKRGGMLVRLIGAAALAVLLLLYELLPQLGLELPGIMNRDDFFISYVLLGLQLAILCGAIFYKQIWEGAKKLFSRTPDAYSVVTALAALVIIYDITVLFVDNTIPHVFHFLWVFTLLGAALSECMSLTVEMRTFEFFFSSVLNNEHTEHGSLQKEAVFTLCKSQGKNSTAEKMYMGGLDNSKNIYFPLELESARNCISAINSDSKKTWLPMLLILPSIAIATLFGLMAMIVSGQFWLAIDAMVVTLFLTMPIVTVCAAWLPFANVNYRGIKSGYAFTSEVGVEEYSSCDLLIFEDLHLFKKATPSNINLALYDATSKPVLLSCLDAVYSRIGGPMCEAFKSEKRKKFENCRINRVARSGIEATVEGTYSVLIGNEQFMSRYGISFPNVTLNNKNDQVFTLCVSINGRATARIAVRYVLNEMFEMFCARLAEDGIYCAIETFDPMISTELLVRVLPKGHVPLSIVHLSAANLKDKNNKIKDSILFDRGEKAPSIVAHTSRLNLVPAISSAKRMKKTGFFSNVISIGACAIGALLAFLTVFFNIVGGISEFYILLYWLLGIGGIVALIASERSNMERYSFEKFLIEKQELQSGTNKKQR